MCRKQGLIAKFKAIPRKIQGGGTTIALSQNYKNKTKIKLYLDIVSS